MFDGSPVLPTHGVAAMKVEYNLLVKNSELLARWCKHPAHTTGSLERRCNVAIFPSKPLLHQVGGSFWSSPISLGRDCAIPPDVPRPIH